MLCRLAAYGLSQEIESWLLAIMVGGLDLVKGHND